MFSPQVVESWVVQGLGLVAETVTETYHIKENNYILYKWVSWPLELGLDISPLVVAFLGVSGAGDGG